MFFEGSEKKIEIIVNSDAKCLRSLGKTYWQSLVNKANADIISVVSNQSCDAYLLSESSLFVWSNKFIMLTCGGTTLVDALQAFIESYGIDNIAFTSFQRKNEYLSHLQKTTFEQDIKSLRKIIDGKAYRLGHLDSHHHFIFHSGKPVAEKTTDKTTELLMYHIRGEGARYLRSNVQTTEGIRALFQLDAILDGFIIDDFVFAPFGYSMNAIKGEYYATLHITPQENSSYVSFETNLDLEREHPHILTRLINCLNPGCWDIVGFNTQPEGHFARDVNCLSHCTLSLSTDVEVLFRYYQHVTHETQTPEAM